VLFRSQSSSKSQAGAVDLGEALDNLRIVLEPFCGEADISLHWDIPGGLPPVWADQHRLLQVLLNLTKNSERALREADVKRIDISARAGKGVVTVRVTDSGPGIGASVSRLFQPFQQGAESTGLGLYLSRAFVRSFRGELRHDPAMPGCSFVIELAVAGADELQEERTGGNGTNTAAVDR
jgi:two-component system, LuxR family, sensor kinase FixL